LSIFIDVSEIDSVQSDSYSTVPQLLQLNEICLRFHSVFYPYFYYY